MKIYVNQQNEIKAIHASNDETLNQYDLDREYVFGDMSDFMILNYCYIPDDLGYSIYPARDYSKLEKEDYMNRFIESEKKVAILEASQNEQDRVIVENDLKLMIINDILGDKTSSVLLRTPFTLEVNVKFNLLKRIIENKNFSTTDDMIICIDTYATHNQITQLEAEELKQLLSVEV